MIGPKIISKQHSGDERTSSLGSHDCDLGWLVVGCVSRLESLRADDIPNTPCHECRGNQAFRLARAVGDRPLVDYNERRDDSVHEVDACEQRITVFPRGERHQAAPMQLGTQQATIQA